MTSSSTDTMESPMRPATNRVDFSRIVIVADDLTGACDSGVAFLSSGRRVRVALDASRVDCEQLQHAEEPNERAVWAFTTETRDSDPDQAAGRVGECLATLGPLRQNALMFKKVRLGSARTFRR